MWELVETIGFLLVIFVLPSTLVRRKPVQGLRSLFCIVPLCLLGLVWIIGLFPLVFAFLGAFVGRPFMAMISALPLVAVQLIPLVASLTMGWEGGWTLGIAGAAAGAVAGAANGWLYNRWIMPEYDKHHARQTPERMQRPVE